MWQDLDWWYSGGATSLRLTLGLVLPAAYALLLLAGLPDRTVPGRVAFGAAIPALAIMGWLVNIESEASTAAAVVFGIIVSILGFWVGVRAIRTKQSPNAAGWALLVPLALQAMIWVPADGIFTEKTPLKDGGLLAHLVIVAVAGLALLVIAMRNRTPTDPAARKEHPPWQA